jgi:hypothetical protein
MHQSVAGDIVVSKWTTFAVSSRWFAGESEIRGRRCARIPPLTWRNDELLHGHSLIFKDDLTWRR